MTTSGSEDPANFAIGRYARFSRESTRLVGGTQPQPDQTLEQVPLPYSRQPSHQKSESEFFTDRHDSPGSSSFNIPKATDRPLTARWLRPGEPVTIAGSTLPGGMLYIGTEHAEYRQSEPSFIDTSLPIASSSAHPAARLVFYWSTYKDLEPEARRGYLQWLAGGRCDPEVPNGYGFMFFHGLERRVLIDTLSEADAREDTPLIEEEINRLNRLCEN
ncbi:TerB N-terminal domain-containing protein, partial [Pseudomonas cannabina]